MSVIQITNSNFEKEVIESRDIVLLDFYATWCGPCRMVAPILEQIAEENPSVKVGKIDVDKEGELASKFGIVSIPTLVVMESGKIRDKIVGARPKEQILELLGI